jgi:cytochrome c-type biogenesis protein CcmH
MTTFVLITALLTALTLALLTRPLWLKATAEAPAGEDTSIVALRQQLEQLAMLHKAGALSDGQYKEAKLALERRIVDAVVKVPAGSQRDKAQAPKALLLGLAAFVCFVAVGGYGLLGTPQGLNPEAVAAQAEAAETGAGHTITAAQIEAMVEKLVARLKERPDDADGWGMLGRTYAVLGRHDQAVPAFKQALQLRPDDAVLIADYADALAVTNGRSLEGEPARLIAQALKIDPNNLKALSLAGTAAFNRQDYAGALRHWEKMTQVAPGSELVQQIQAGIDEARKRMGGPPAAPAAAQVAPKGTPATGAAVSGVVTLAASLAGKAAPDDTLFVFARAAEGPRMPLAILRKQVKDLPLTFTLDDSMAMSPAARLSLAGRVVVGARVSKRGDATAQPGDLQGLSAPVSPGAGGLKIEIAEVVGP